MKILVFSLDKYRYAVLLSAAERVLRMVEITPLPKAPDSVLGIINLHGTIIPVFNLRHRFGLSKRETQIQDQIIITHTARRKVALAVEMVQGIIDLIDSCVSCADILPSMPYVTSVVKLPDGMVLITNLDDFLSLHEEEVLIKAMSGERD